MSEFTGKFKVGDVVRYVGNYNERLYGRKFTIVGIDDQSDCPYRLEVTTVESLTGTFDCYEKSLEHIRIKNTKLARRLYPDYKEDGEWLIIT